MSRLAIGPRSRAPSWEWIGQSLADRLASRFSVEVFDDFGAARDAEVVLVVKQRPTRNFMHRAQQGGAQVIYAPVDIYASEAEIAEDADILRACSLVLVHSDALRTYLQPYCSALISIDHHARFAIDPAEAKGDAQFILWIGALQHVPHLIRWHECVRPSCELLILANIGDPRARLAAHAAGHAIGLRLRVTKDSVNGIAALDWSPERQQDLMRACRAAVDIKGSSFSQLTKPPTKAQQFIASGIPLGVNGEHPAVAWFHARGFEIADASDWDRLLSPHYRDQTRDFARDIRQQLSIEAVEATVLEALAPLWPCQGARS